MIKVSSYFLTGKQVISHKEQKLIDNSLVRYKMQDWRKDKKTVGDKLDYFSKIKGDVTFSVGDPDLGQVEEIQASVFILRALSPVFETMFDDKWKGQEEIIPLPDIQPKIFRHFLNVC